MKRFHMHVGVADLDASIAFYTHLFGAQPSVVKADYAKWMLDDPRINFAISMREGAAKGIEHVGRVAGGAQCRQYADFAHTGFMILHEIGSAIWNLNVKPPITRQVSNEKGA